MNRVSTAGNYAAMLANLMRAQQGQMFYGAQVATQKKGSDLKAFSSTADTLTAMNTVKARLQSYQDQNGVIADRLASQDVALNQVTDAAGKVREAIANALATGSAQTLMEEVTAQLSSAVEGMNARYNGLDDSTTITSGVLASDIGTQLLQAFQAIQDSPVGPFAGKLTQAQETWLQGQLGTWDGVRRDLTGMTAANGLIQRRVDTSKTSVIAQDTTLTGMIGDVTDADMGMAATQLQMAQMSVQAAGHVFQTLQGASLLSMLPIG
jgi:flagellar hook-associated protein 3 FlgL